ncbi:hypothetical protein RJ641_004375 [Dillenia turbinata]|uniref:Protein TAPETUM DETERMINANT 1-like n=1 Tax=Dillenia turbinata TaxID=194707 RepID=A0AAN8VI90_9MAGN
MSSSSHIFFLLCLMFLIIVSYNTAQHSENLQEFSKNSPCSLSTGLPNNTYSVHGGNNQSAMAAEQTHFSHRKLLAQLQGTCTSRDISISQSKDSTSGIPEYIVQIVNTCVSGCAPSNIHLHCGWFASARIVNPKTFKRLLYDDCLVNAGKPLKTSQIIRFTYSNSFMYPISLKSAKLYWVLFQGIIGAKGKKGFQDEVGWEGENDRVSLVKVKGAKVVKALSSVTREMLWKNILFSLMKFMCLILNLKSSIIKC